MTLKIIEVVPDECSNLAEGWARHGIKSIQVTFEQVLNVVQAPANPSLIVDAIVIRGTERPREYWDSPMSEASADMLGLAERIRCLPEEAAMFDGKRWQVIPIVLMGPSDICAEILNRREEVETDILDDIEVLWPQEGNKWGADLINKEVEEYRMAVLSEFDNLGFIVSYERGRYRVGPALQSKGAIEGRYYFGPADKRAKGFFTLHRDEFAIQLEVEEFEALINRNDVREQELQGFFERHPHFLSQLHTPLPHIRIPKKDGSVLIPDFILKPIFAQQRDSKWEVIDLKLPQQRLLAGKGSRARLSSKVLDAIRQVRDYAEHLRDPDYPDKIAALLGHRLKRPTIGVLIGRLANTDIDALEREQQQYAGVKIITYDEILELQQNLLSC